MLRIIKKDGRKVEFEREKIKVSIANTANDINFILNHKDIELIAKEIEEKIIKARGKDGLTSSLEVVALIIDTLHRMGFIKLADAYYNGSFKEVNAKYLIKKPN